MCSEPESNWKGRVDIKVKLCLERAEGGIGMYLEVKFVGFLLKGLLSAT